MAKFHGESQVDILRSNIYVCMSSANIPSCAIKSTGSKLSLNDLNCNQFNKNEPFVFAIRINNIAD